MCHFYSFRQSAPKPSVGIISHLCHYATCILHRLGNFIKRILVCCFEAGKLHSNFGNERKLKHREIFRVMWQKLRLDQKGSHWKPDWSRSQCIMTVIIQQNKLKKGLYSTSSFKAFSQLWGPWNEKAFPTTPIRESRSQQELRSYFLAYPAQNLISLLLVPFTMLGGFEVPLFIETTLCQWRAWRNWCQLDGKGFAGLQRQKSVTLNWV